MHVRQREEGGHPEDPYRFVPSFWSGHRHEANESSEREAEVGDQVSALVKNVSYVCRFEVPVEEAQRENRHDLRLGLYPEPLLSLQLDTL